MDTKSITNAVFSALSMEEKRIVKYVDSLKQGKCLDFALKILFDMNAHADLYDKYDVENLARPYLKVEEVKSLTENLLLRIAQRRNDRKLELEARKSDPSKNIGEGKLVVNAFQNLLLMNLNDMLEKHNIGELTKQKLTDKIVTNLQKRLLCHLNNRKVKQDDEKSKKKKRATELIQPSLPAQPSTTDVVNYACEVIYDRLPVKNVAPFKKMKMVSSSESSSDSDYEDELKKRPVKKRGRQQKSSKIQFSVSQLAVDFESVRNEFEAMKPAEKLEFVTANPQFIEATEETFQALSGEVFNSRKALPKRHKSWFHYYKFLMSKQPKKDVKISTKSMEMSDNSTTGFDPRHVAAVLSFSARPMEPTTRSDNNHLKKDLQAAPHGMDTSSEGSSSSSSDSSSSGDSSNSSDEQLDGNIALSEANAHCDYEVAPSAIAPSQQSLKLNTINTQGASINLVNVDSKQSKIMRSLNERVHEAKQLERRDERLTNTSDLRFKDHSNADHFPSTPICANTAKNDPVNVVKASQTLSQSKLDSNVLNTVQLMEKRPHESEGLEVKDQNITSQNISSNNLNLSQDSHVDDQLASTSTSANKKSDASEDPNTKMAHKRKNPDAPEPSSPEPVIPKRRWISNNPFLLW